MVPLLGKRKRHRFSDIEISNIIKGLILRLESLYETRKDPANAVIVYNLLIKLLNDKKGRPKKTVPSWENMKILLNIYAAPMQEWFYYSRNGSIIIVFLLLYIIGTNICLKDSDLQIPKMDPLSKLIHVRACMFLVHYGSICVRMH